MSEISWIVIFLAGLNFLLIKLIIKKSNVSIFLIISWWFIWLFVSTFSLGGLKIPSNQTYYLFLVMISSVTVGGCFFSFSSLKKSNKRILLLENKLTLTKNQLKAVKRIYTINYFVAFPVITYFCAKAIQIIISNPAIIAGGFRNMVFEDNLVFGGDPFISTAYRLIIAPILYSSIFIGVALYSLYDDVRLLLLSSMMMMMDAIIYLGRFGFYRVFILVCLSLIYKKRSSLLTGFKFLFKSKFFYITLIIVLVGIARITSDRLSSSASLLRELINSSLINYHTLGFSLFDHSMMDLSSPLNQRSYGIVSLGNLVAIFSIFLRKIGFETSSANEEMGNYLAQAVIIGHSSDGTPLIYNAFGTVLYSIYQDGGLLLTIFLPFIYGFYLVKLSSQSMRSPNLYNVSTLTALVYIGIFGIFQPLLAGSYWLYIILIWVLVGNKKIFSKQKREAIKYH